ncbi:protein translocase subunit SecD [Syntrophothermus lipocalidus]|uniref:Protein translocase subunit SecD n=1 Tax=Syntrophothermus lipocalidus (strain DSM 12680 / TGB-C1) TaxID=643648 RepID=D7CLE7_SYNLT|nr:protein translocase subunit SecD [Syntrophothermus lipocalidus]ADI01532.1 protein-export membrane protein SecD [Syntrophothermus lipocalidus DSM 12680]
MSNRTGLIKLIAMLIAVGIVAYVAYQPIIHNLNLGLDLRGGVHVVMEAKERPGQKITDDTLKKTVGVLRNRVDRLGVKEPVIQTQGDRRVIIELAGVKDPNEAIRVIGKTAELQFIDENGKVWVTGRNLKDAKAGIDQEGQPKVDLTFDKEGAELFRKATKENLGKRIAIVLDKEIISQPVVRNEIPSGQAEISGGFESAKDAENLAVLLRSGALPVTLEMAQKWTVGPTLGSDSLAKSIKAGIIGLLAILIFMIGYYRLPGFLADISLVVYSMLVLGVMALGKFTLTLPGIAGFLLSIGMAVDANIIIYERLKDELRAGKTLLAAVDAGFKRAFWTIFDSNLTTLIAAVILMYFGIGPIKGFAVTLAIGIVTSMFTAVVFTRWLLKWAAESFRNPKYYGV